MTKFDPEFALEVMKRRQADCNKRADSYDSVIDYLEDRVWGEKTEAEKVWETIKDWDATYGPLLVEDVLHGLDIVRGEKF